MAIRFQYVLDQKRLVGLMDETDKMVAEIDLSMSTVTNKFYLVTNFIEDMSKNSIEFTEWLVKFMEDYINTVDKYELLEQNVPLIKKYADEYITSKKIDFSLFVDETKAKKTSILLTAEEIEKICRLSSYLKIYSLISNTEKLKLDRMNHKKIYNLLAEDILQSEATFKIFNIVKTKTFRYNLTDKYMWDYIKMIQCKSIDMHVVEIFNFIMNSIIVLCEPERNPITYFVGVVNESIKWVLGSIYKGSIIYDDSISTEDIQSTNIDNLKTYSYNDTLGRLKAIAYEKIKDNISKPGILKFDESEMRQEDEYIDIQKRVESVQFISPLSEYFVFPILAKVTEIPYNHLKTLSPEHSIVLSVYTQDILKRVFKTNYKNIISLLNYYPTQKLSATTAYKIKNMQNFVNTMNDVKNFFGIDTKILLGNILGNFVGKISRIKFNNIFDGKSLAGGVPLSKIEEEMIDFYILFFADKLDLEIQKIRHLVQCDF
jgi:hypothetical protein